MTILEDARLHDLVGIFYSASAGDLVGLWEIAKEVESLVGVGDTARKQSLEIVRALLAKGLLAGDPPYDAGGYAPWPDQDPDKVINRMDREWLKLGRTPNIPDIAWLGRPHRGAQGIGAATTAR